MKNYSYEPTKEVKWNHTHKNVHLIQKNTYKEERKNKEQVDQIENKIQVDRFKPNDVGEPGGSVD